MYEVSKEEIDDLISALTQTQLTNLYMLIQSERGLSIIEESINTKLAEIHDSLSNLW